MKKYIAEFIGTFVLVTLACGVAVVVGCGTAGGVVATSLAFGLVIVAMAYSVGNISGCHINPAVSLAMLITKKITGKEFLFYVISQFLGATAGALVLGAFTKQFENLGGNVAQATLVNAYGDVGSLFIALLVEVVLTFVFVFAILGVTSKTENSTVTGVVIGLTLTLVHLLGIGLTGTSVNPARSFGPALLQAFAGNTDALAQIWIFIVGPLVGAAIAAFVHMALTKEKK
ncbi:MAG: aquaporin [Ruminococcaceae bacterium]|nr:aquaporin [Oscillospiraceae bacterium]